MSLWIIAWGLGWLFMPRMTIGILLMCFFPEYWMVGFILAIIGAILDCGSASNTRQVNTSN